MATETENPAAAAGSDGITELAGSHQTSDPTDSTNGDLPEDEWQPLSPEMLAGAIAPFADDGVDEISDVLFVDMQRPGLLHPEVRKHLEDRLESFRPRPETDEERELMRQLEEALGVERANVGGPALPPSSYTIIMEQAAIEGWDKPEDAAFNIRMDECERRSKADRKAREAAEREEKVRLDLQPGNLDTDHLHEDLIRLSRADRTLLRAKIDYLDEWHDSFLKGHSDEDGLPVGIRDGDENDVVAVDWLVYQELPAVGTGLYAGDQGTAKTPNLIDIGISCGTGLPYAGNREIDRKCGTVIFNNEGQAGHGARKAAAKTEMRERMKLAGMKVPARLPLVVIPDDLTLKNDFAKIRAICQREHEYFMREFKLPLGLVAFDTLTNASGAESDNDASEWIVIMKMMNQLAQELQAFVFGVAHTGKDVTKGVMGSAIKERNADVIWLTDRDKHGNYRVFVKKCKPGENGRTFTFGLRQREVGTDNKRRPITAMSVNWDIRAVHLSDNAIAALEGLKPDAPAVVFMEVLKSELAKPSAVKATEQQPFPAVPYEALRQPFYNRYPTVTQDTKRQRLGRALELLEAKRVVRKIGPFVYYLDTTEADNAQA